MCLSAFLWCNFLISEHFHVKGFNGNKLEHSSEAVILYIYFKVAPTNPFLAAM